jgi:carboxypeptidase family protein/TonB-dependent receptor-like protein
MYNDNGSLHQAVAIDPFNFTNLFFNDTLRGTSRPSQSRLRLAINKLTDSHRHHRRDAGRRVSVSFSLGYSPVPLRLRGDRLRHTEVNPMPARVALRLSVICLLIGSLSPRAYAQFDTASVVGAVRDASGAVVPGATVTLTSSATGVSATKTSAADGSYEFFAVRPGTYIVTAEKSGFAVALVDNVQVQVAARLRVDLQMSIGQVSEKVEVTAAAPLIETDTSQRDQVISGYQMVALPLNGREYSALALLTTGVRQSALNRSTNGTPREGAFNVNGLRSTFNNFLIDGVDNNAYGTSNQGFSNQVMQPPPDAVGEFKVVTNNESAEYGRSAGATVNVSYKSGTNQLHGDSWEFFRNTALNANSYFRPVTGEKPPLNRNQFGAVLGGPIVPNKAFFFGDYEGFRQDRKLTTFSTIPTAIQKNGILPVDVRDPRTGALYPAGTPIPMTAFARTTLSGLPDPNVAGAANNYSTLQDFTNHSNKAGGKVDLQPTRTVSLFGRYGWRDLETVDQPPLPLPSGGDGNGTIYARNKQFVAGATYAASDRSLLEVRFGWSSTQGGKNPPALGGSSALDAFGIAGLPTDSRIVGGLPTQLITGYSNLGRQATNPQWQYPTIWNPKVNYTWLVGRQSLKAGYELQHIAVQVMDVNPLYGRDTYAGQFARPAGAASNNLYNLADFMLGLRSQYALSNALVAEMRRNMHFTYLQDDVRLNDRLTLNAGLRYEYATPMWEANNVLSNFDPTTHSMVIAKDGSITDRALVNPDRNNFAPRLGFAYTPLTRTVVRGGYGISYVHNNRVGAADLLPINGPQVINAVINQSNPLDPSFRATERGYPAALTDPSTFNPLTANITYIPQDFQAGRVQSWFASVQREIGPNMLLDAAYVGNKGDNLLLLANYNQARPNNAAGTISLQARRPIADFSDITYVFNGGLSRYDALQLKYEWRLGADINVLSSLTLSTAKDNGAQSLENNNGNFPGPQDFYNLAAEYGTGAYHQPYNSTTSFVWSVPFGRTAWWGGWQLAGINTVIPGETVTFVYTPLASASVSGIQQDFRGANNYRPNVVCDPYAAPGQQSITNWFNKDCVVAPTDPSQPFGNAGRNTVRGPNFWQFDAAASKRFDLGAVTKLEVRVEAFNLFNRANFTAPSGNRSSGGFGTITSTYDPRQVQLGAKIIW